MLITCSHVLPGCVAAEEKLRNTENFSVMIQYHTSQTTGRFHSKVVSLMKVREQNNIQCKAALAVVTVSSYVQLPVGEGVCWVCNDRQKGEWSDGESGRRARKALLHSRWVFNEVERLPGLFLPAVVTTKPRYLALALCPAWATIPPNDGVNT